MIDQLSTVDLERVCGGLMAGVKDGVRIQCGESDGEAICHLYGDNGPKRLKLSPRKPFSIRMNAPIAG